MTLLLPYYALHFLSINNFFDVNPPFTELLRENYEYVKFSRGISNFLKQLYLSSSCISIPLFGCLWLFECADPDTPASSVYWKLLRSSPAVHGHSILIQASKLNFIFATPFSCRDIWSISSSYLQEVYIFILISCSCSLQPLLQESWGLSSQHRI